MWGNVATLLISRGQFLFHLCRCQICSQHSFLGRPQVEQEPFPEAKALVKMSIAMIVDLHVKAGACFPFGSLP